jgi:rsbT antagonist protein RsbS
MHIPILRLGRLLLTSIQTDLTDDDAGRLQADVLGFLHRDEADGLVLDITGLDVVDSYMARLLNETARMARLMGGEVVLTGMQPMVALTLVEMGREIIGIDTAIDLEAGVARLNGLIKARGHGDAGHGALMLGSGAGHDPG